MLIGLVVALTATMVPALGAAADEDKAAPETASQGSEVEPDLFEPGEVNRTPVGTRPTDPPPGWDPDVPADVEVGDELVELRSVTSKTYTGEAGGLVTEVFTGPVHHESDPGVFVELDRSVRVAGQAGRAGQEPGPVSVEVPASLAGGPVRVADDRGGEVSFVMPGASSSPVDAEGDRAVYREVFDGVDVELTGTGLGVKEELILAGPDTVRAFEFNLSLSDGLVPSLSEDGGLVVEDAAGETRFVFDAPFMFDDAEQPDFSTDLDVTLDERDGGWTLSWTADDAWLDDEARAWPVTIDPTVTIDGAASESCWISDPAWYGCTQDQALRAGDDNGRQARGLMRFDLEDAIGEPAQVRRAHVQLDDASSTGTPVTAHQVTTGWTRGEVDWTNAAWGTPWDSAGGDFDSEALAQSDGSSSQGYRFQVPGMVQAWVNGGTENHGLLLRAVDESDPAVRWDPDVSLVVEWTPLVGMHQHATLETQELDDRRGLHVDVVSGNLMLTETDVQIAGTAGADLALTRTYNHLLANDGFVEDSPAGWTTPTRRIPNDLEWGGGLAVYRDLDSGYTVLFIEQDDGSYEPASRIDAKLEQDPSDATFTLTWNQSGEVYYYHPWGYIDAIEDRSGNRIQYHYDSGLRISSIVDTQGRVTTFERDGGQIESMTDPVGRTHTYSYDPTDPDRLLEVEDPAGNIFVYDETSTPDHVQLMTDTAGNQTRITYQTGTDFPRVEEITRITDPVAGTGPTTSFDYDPDERVTVVTDPIGNDTTYHYDQAGKVETVIDALGNERGSGYDSNGNVTTYTSPRGSEMTSRFDDETNNLLGVDQPTGSGTTLSYSYGFDNEDLPYARTSSTNPQGGVVSYAHDTLGRLESVTDESGPGGKAEIEYNANGTPKKTIDPNGNETTYDYDDDGNLEGVSPPSPLGDVAIVVDALSRVVATTDGEGRTVSYGYDISDRVRQVTYPGLQVNHTYDTAGNLTARSDASGTTSYAYDKLNRLTGETRPGDVESVYTYDATGNLRHVNQDGVGITDFTFDDANQLKTATPPRAPGEHGNLTIQFGYDDDGNRDQTAYPNGVTQVAEIDDAGRLLEVEATRGSTTLTRFTYDYMVADPDDPNEEVDTMFRQSVTDLDGVTTTYTYDELSRLKNAVRADGPTVLHDWSYDYDDNTNRKSATHNGATTTYNYNAADQLIDAGSTTLNYDDVGNLTNIGNGATTFAYNGADQTTSITTGGDTLSFAYAGQNQVERTAAGDTDFTYNALGVVAADDTSFTRDDAGTLLGMLTPSIGRFYYLFDGLGSVVAVTDLTGQIVNTYDYDPYGQTISATEQVSNPWRFTGEWHDDSTNMYKIGHRYYQPEHGRWTQRDPSGADLNPYTYVAGNPTNMTDPTGLWGTQDCGIFTCSLWLNVESTQFLADHSSTATGSCTALGKVVPLAVACALQIGGLTDYASRARADDACLRIRYLAPPAPSPLAPYVYNDVRCH